MCVFGYVKEYHHEFEIKEDDKKVPVVIQHIIKLYTTLPLQFKWLDVCDGILDVSCKWRRYQRYLTGKKKHKYYASPEDGCIFTHKCYHKLKDLLKQLVKMKILMDINAASETPMKGWTLDNEDKYYYFKAIGYGVQVKMNDITVEAALYFTMPEPEKTSLVFVLFLDFVEKTKPFVLHIIFFGFFRKAQNHLFYILFFMSF